MNTIKGRNLNEKKDTKSHASKNNGMQSSQLMKLFEDSLKDLYWAEKALTKALPEMAKKASSPDLVEALNHHLTETEIQLERIEEIFELIEKKAVAKKCDAMEGLIKEGQSIMKECEEGSMRDAGIISAAQKIEHYEIASYGTLKTFAHTLGLKQIAELLEETLEEEKASDEKLTEVALSAINIQASENEVEAE
ncbi:MAG: ferritin-like domain-containing protein [Chryseotalea sp.]